MSSHALHRLKIKQEFAILYFLGLKNWELRFNDRDFKDGDYVEFEVVETGAVYVRQIVNIFSDEKYGLQKGFVILSIEQSE